MPHKLAACGEQASDRVGIQGVANASLQPVGHANIAFPADVRQERLSSGNLVYCLVVSDALHSVGRNSKTFHRCFGVARKSFGGVAARKLSSLENCSFQFPIACHEVGGVRDVRNSGVRCPAVGGK